MNKEELIKRVKECGQSLIDNAESIVGNESMRRTLSITCYVSNVDEIPTISINREFIPEGFVDRNTHSPSAHMVGTKCPACEENDKRTCSECGNGILGGYYVDANTGEYYCCDECWHKHVPQVDSIKEFDKRICLECGKEMEHGYCIDGGKEYYCSEWCLHQHHTEEEYEGMYDAGVAYWTSWVEDLPDDYKHNPRVV